MSHPQVRFGTGNVARRLDDFVEWIRTAEDVGFQRIGTGDSQSLWADPYVTLTVAALNTKNVKIGLHGTNPVTRHPAVTASAIASVHQVSGGRAYVAIATGDSALYNIGKKPAKLVELEEYALAVKGLCAGETVHYQGESLRMEWKTDPVPIFLGVAGPKGQRLAGRIADGVLLANGLTKDVVQDSLRNIREGAEQAGRDFSEIDIWWIVPFRFASTEAEGIDALRFLFAALANHTFRFTMEGKHVPEELRDRVRGLQRDYEARAHAIVGEGEFNADLVEKYELKKYLANRFVITGPPERVVERIHEVAEYGATNLIFGQFFPDQIAQMRILGDKVFPVFR